MSDKKTIVAADDEPFILSAVKDTLGDDYNVFTATDGKSALVMMKKHKADLVVLDIMMPEMDGIEVCRNMKNDPALEFIPIVLLTAKGQMPDIEKGFKAGADAYVVKPFSPGKLVEKIEEMFKVSAKKEKIRAKNIK